MSEDNFEQQIANIREEYAGAPLRKRNVAANPFVQFRRWFDEAIHAKIHLSNGMSLATVGDDGRPSVRIVLLKDVDATGFVFYTNRTSRKAQELAANSNAALLLWWSPLARQVRLEGHVHELSAEQSDRYFATRPRGSNLGAIASSQSTIIANRQVLEDTLAKVRTQYEGVHVSRPSYWGGYRLVPDMFEFWQGRCDRLHDRLRYRKQQDTSWIIERLAP